MKKIRLEYWWSWASGDGDGYEFTYEVTDEIYNMLEVCGERELSMIRKGPLVKWYRSLRSECRDNNYGPQPNKDGIRYHKD